MHIVYQITFTNRQKQGIRPFLYIGSKSNCSYREGVIYDKNGKPYWGSSTWENWSTLIKEDLCIATVLYESDSYTKALNFENSIQKQLDVVASSLYFNLAIATVNSYSDPAYATYTNGIKTVRLPRTHESVLSGEYYGVTKGNILSKEHKRKLVRLGKDNGFYGKSHNEETKAKISNANAGRIKTKEEIENWIDKVAKKPKSEIHKLKIGRKGLIMIKSLETNECRRIHKTENYDKLVWVNPIRWKKLKEKQ